MRFGNFTFGSLQIEGDTYEHDVVIDRGEIRKRKKTPSKRFRDNFGHTPLSVERHTMEMRPAHHRHRSTRQPAGDE
jgi:hypothetical protein